MKRTMQSDQVEFSPGMQGWFNNMQISKCDMSYE